MATNREENLGTTSRWEVLWDIELTLTPYFQLIGDDGDVAVQRVIEEQLEAGQGAGLTTQEFEDRFFL